jgi:hypothetical protein
MSFILEALKKVDRKKDDAQDGVLMQGGRRWGETRFPWALVGVVFVAVVALALASVALIRSFQGEAAEAPLVETTSPAPSSIRVPAEETAIEDLDRAPSPDERPIAEASEARNAPVRTETPATPAPVDTEDIPATEETDVEDVGAAPPVRLVGRASDGPSLAEVDTAADEEPPSELPSLVLQGTSVIDGKPVAVVNYQRLFEGDFIEGARVVKILDRAVELDFKGTRFTIRL